MKKDRNRKKSEDRMRKKSPRKGFSFVIILAAALVLAVAITVVYATEKKEAPKEEEKTEAEPDTAEETEGQVIHNGVTYQYKENLKTLLFLGVDKRETNLSEHLPGRGGQADCILLFVMDSEKKEITILEISRDTMVDVDVYDINGELFTTEKGQITLQYAYGDGKTKSCWLMKEAVSRLLYGVGIDSCFAMNLEGFSTATDLVGGVELTVPEDYTQIDPAFEKGATLTLDGELAQKYVQTRDITVTGSNDGRMERQTQFLEALAQKMTQNGGNVVSYTKMFTELQDYIVTDMSADELAELSDYEFAGTRKAPGETHAGEEHDEYYVDEDALYELILELFYEPVQQ